jgi:hypothetical protein
MQRVDIRIDNFNGELPDSKIIDIECMYDYIHSMQNDASIHEIADTNHNEYFRFFMDIDCKDFNKTIDIGEIEKNIAAFMLRYFNH